MNNLRRRLKYLEQYKTRALQILKILIVIFIIVMFLITRARVDRFTRQLNDDLYAMYHEPMTLTFQVEQEIPIEIDMPMDEFIDMSKLFPSEIPYEITIPIKTTVDFNQDVRVPVNIPFLGFFELDIPLDLSFPVDENISISTTVEVDQSAFKTPDNIEIRKDIPVNMPITMELSIEEMGIEPRMDGILSLINTLRFVFLLRSIELKW